MNRLLKSNCFERLDDSHVDIDKKMTSRLTSSQGAGIVSLTSKHVSRLNLYCLVLYMFSIFPHLSYADESLRWKSSPSQSGAYHDTLGEAIEDFKSVGGIYQYITELKSTVDNDDHIMLTFKIPNSDPYISDWVYGINSHPCTGDEMDSVLDCHQTNMIEYLSGHSHMCSPYYEIDKNSGNWYGSRQNPIARDLGIYTSERRSYRVTIYGIQKDRSCGVNFDGHGGLYGSRVREVECQFPTILYDRDNDTCYRSGLAYVRGYPQYYLSPKPDFCSVEGNPCSPATGNKTQTETDYVLSGKGLKVQRHYASQGIGDGYNELGPRWRHNYGKHLDGYDEPAYTAYQGTKTSLYKTPREACLNGWNELKGALYSGLLSEATPKYSTGVCNIQQGSTTLMKLLIHNTLNGSKGSGLHALTQSNGHILVFQSSSNEWQSLFPSQQSFVATDDGWTYKSAGGVIEVYSSEGRLLSSQGSNRLTTEYTYDEDGHLDTVTGPYGDRLTYYYNEGGNLIRITTPDGDLKYHYDSEGRLSRVVNIDNSERIYHYENPDYPHHLTGITDENADRFATWDYDAEGRAILSEHANGAEQVEFTYNPDGSTTVTDAKGAVRTYHFTVQQGKMKVDHIEGDRCTTCAGGGIQSYTYDENGFTASKTDWNGNTTSYTRDEQGRALSRTEAASTPQARTITTTWDSSLNKPLVVTEPDRVTEYSYDTAGRLQSKTQHALQ